jgi:hypothetical protein
MKGGARRRMLPRQMGAMERDPVATGTLRCAGCGGVIGVYEPLVHVAGGIAHRTSRAADPDLAWSQTEACYHAACHEALGGGGVIVA